jgi:hypothetical protein
MAKADERVVRQFALRFDKSEILLPKRAEVLAISQLHDRPFLFVICEILLSEHEARTFLLIDTGRAYERKQNQKYVGSIFALQRHYHCFEETSEAR